ncbi:hypothetical protein L612_007800000020 [Rhodococcus rhodochrous J38]|uniref:DUF7172 family protein n=1 Tax=Rhodococcus rhodochrous TaxID=1829 RepID=UPI0011AB1074|nr:hypothetical protein [Rhodococcus rhodochrous]MCB8914026.1 hypothetical protein [Rhodococcus rhodochrous]TWH37591.1 hypothetical protein L612_007800000020 [Rhodococcus rhodochrous J38]
MAQVCVSQNLDISTGALAVQPWSVPRHVYDQSFASVGNGVYGPYTNLPGKLMIDSGVQEWVNPTPLPAQILFRLHRGSRRFIVSSPNVVQVRDRFTTAIGAVPRTPDTSNQYQSAAGGGVDMSTTTAARPYAGVLRAWDDAMITEEWFGPVPPGEAFRFHYRATLWTPPPWSNNANDNLPIHECDLDPVRIQLLAFPTQDMEVMG